MTIAAGTVTTWDTSAVINGTTRKGTTYTGNGQVALPKIWVTGMGIKVNYDAGDADVGEGKIVQEFFDTGGSDFLKAMNAKLGNVGILVLTDEDEATTETNSVAMLIKVADTTPIQGTRNATWGQLTWEILGTWT